MSLRSVGFGGSVPSTSLASFATAATSRLSRNERLAGTKFPLPDIEAARAPQSVGHEVKR